MGPYTPTSMEREHHSCTGHAVYRSWCPSCVKGRGRSSPHTAKDHTEDEIPVLSWDYAFLRPIGQEAAPDANPEQATIARCYQFATGRVTQCFGT